MQPVTDLRAVASAFNSCPSMVSLRNQIETAGAKIGLMLQDKPFYGETPRSWERNGLVHFDMNTPFPTKVFKGEVELFLFVSHSPKAFNYKRIAHLRISNANAAGNINALAETSMKTIANVILNQRA